MPKPRSPISDPWAISPFRICHISRSRETSSGTVGRNGPFAFLMWRGMAGWMILASRHDRG
eukprot:4541143-Prorocentrum_lima.AAC.1